MTGRAGLSADERKKEERKEKELWSKKDLGDEVREEGEKIGGEAGSSKKKLDKGQLRRGRRTAHHRDTAERGIRQRRGSSGAKKEN